MKKDFVVNETILRVGVSRRFFSPQEISFLFWIPRVLTHELVLQESKAGLAVGKLRQHESKEVADLAKEVVKKWKNEVEKAKAQAGGSAAGQKAGASTPFYRCRGCSGSFRGSSGRKASTASVATPVTPTPKPEVRRATTDGVSIAVTGDPTRDKCVELIYDALASDSGAREYLIHHLDARP